MRNVCLCEWNAFTNLLLGSLLSLLLLSSFSFLFGQFAITILTFSRQFRISHRFELQISSRARIVITTVTSSYETIKWYFQLIFDHASVYFQWEVLHSGLRSMAFGIVWFCFRTRTAWNVVSWTWNFWLWIWFDVNMNWFTGWWLSAANKANINTWRILLISLTLEKKCYLPDASAGGVCVSSQCFHVAFARWQRNWALSKCRMRWMRILMVWARERCACWIWTTATKSYSMFNG